MDVKGAYVVEVHSCGAPPVFVDTVADRILANVPD